MYRSEPYLPEFYRRTLDSVRNLTEDYEIIFVNDGSPDASLDVAIDLSRKDSRVTIVDLSRNFGHHKAIMTGLGYASGDLIFLLDCDLEEDPELVLTFHEDLTSSKADVVYGVQSARKGSLFERFTGWLYYVIIDALWDQKIPRNLVTARLMTKRYVAQLLRYRESELVISGLWLATGFTQRAIPVKKHSKPTSTYTVRMKIALLVRTITAFSDKPLRYIAYLGATILFVSFLFIVALGAAFIGGHPPQGYASLIVSVWFLGGLTIFSIGIVAIYLSVVFLETKRRPNSIVREIHGRDVPRRDEREV